MIFRFTRFLHPIQKIYHRNIFNHENEIRENYNFLLTLNFSRTLKDIQKFKIMCQNKNYNQFKFKWKFCTIQG